MANLLSNPVQIGVVGLRDPEDPKKIIENIPVYAEGTPEIKEQDEKTMEYVAKVFAEKFRQYAEAAKKV